jgi:histidine kinase
MSDETPRLVGQHMAPRGYDDIVRLAGSICGAPLVMLHVDGALVARSGPDDAGFRVFGSGALAGGALSVFDAVPRELTPLQAEALQVLAQEIGARMALERVEACSRGLTAQVVHDIQNPLASLIPNAMFITEESALSDDGRIAASDLLHVSDSLRRLVLDLQDLASNRIRPNSTPIDVAVVLAASAQAILFRAEEAGIALRVIGQTALAVSDAALLRRVFENLLDYAVRYAPPDSTVTAEIVADAASVVVQFRDAGGAIPLVYRESVFDPYGASTPGVPRAMRWGRALALPFCRSALEALGGTIRAEGEGELCLFVVTLPEGR